MRHGSRARLTATDHIQPASASSFRPIGMSESNTVVPARYKIRLHYLARVSACGLLINVYVRHVGPNTVTHARQKVRPQLHSQPCQCHCPHCLLLYGSLEGSCLGVKFPRPVSFF